MGNTNLVTNLRSLSYIFQDTIFVCYCVYNEYRYGSGTHFNCTPPLPNSRFRALAHAATFWILQSLNTLTRMRGSGVLATMAVACGVLLLDSATTSVRAHGHNHNTHCVRWRATGRCDPHGVREPHNDATCTKTIASGLSGYCECEDRRRVREVACGHHEFTCAEACAEDSSSELTCTCCKVVVAMNMSA